MANTKSKKIEKRIDDLKREILDIGDMRPGTLSVQYRKPSEKKIPFQQLSYTHKTKSRSEYVRSRNLETIKREIDNYRKFKKLIEKIVDLSIQSSKLRIEEAKNTKTSSQAK